MRIGIFAAAIVAIFLAGCGGAQARKSAYLASGRRHMAAHDYVLARLEFRNAAQLDPNDAEAYFLAGQAAQHLEKLTEAAQLYQSAINADRRHLGARAQLAKLYVAAGRVDQAAALLAQGFAIASEDPGLLTARSATRQRQGDIAGARTDAEKAVQLAPSDADSLAQLASVYSRSGNPDRAIELLEKAVAGPAASVDLRLALAQALLAAGRHAEAAQQMQRIIAMKPDQLVFRYRLAQLFLLDKNVSAAEGALRAAVGQAPRSAEAKRALADFLASYRSFELGENEIKHILALSPRDARLRLALGDFYRTHARPRQAESTYRGIIRDVGTSQDGLAARDHLAGMYLSENALTAADGMLEEVLRTDPHDNDALLLRGDLWLRRGKPEAAIRDLRSAQHDRPTSVAIERALADAYLRNDDRTLAEETLRSAVQNHPEDTGAKLDLANLLAETDRRTAAIALLTRFADEEPADLDVLERLFELQMARDDYDAALSTAARVQRALPSSHVGAYMEGLAALASGQPQAARAALERAAALTPGAIETSAALVRLDLSERREDQALVRLQRIAAQFPKDPAVWDFEGEVLAELNRFDAAIPSLRTAVTLAPGSPRPCVHLAALQSQLGNNDAAISTLRQGIQRSPDALPLVVSLASLYERIGRPNAAIAEYENLLQHKGDSAAAVNNLAMLLATYRSDQSSLERARELSQRFRRSAQPAFIDTWGWVMYKRGDTAEALSALQKAVAKSPQAPVLRYHLAMAQMKAGERDAALANLEQAVKPGVKFSGSDEAQRALVALKGG